MWEECGSHCAGICAQRDILMNIRFIANTGCFPSLDRHERDTPPITGRVCAVTAPKDALFSRGESSTGGKSTTHSEKREHVKTACVVHIYAAAVNKACNIWS